MKMIAHQTVSVHLPASLGGRVSENSGGNQEEQEEQRVESPGDRQ
jgi:hypothetical protein